MPGLASPLQLRHYYEEADPDRALAMLEEEMSDITSVSSATHAADRSAKGLDKLRTLLERECEAQARPLDDKSCNSVLSVLRVTHGQRRRATPLLRFQLLMQCLETSSGDMVASACCSWQIW